MTQSEQRGASDIKLTDLGSVCVCSRGHSSFPKQHQDKVKVSATNGFCITLPFVAVPSTPCDCDCMKP